MNGSMEQQLAALLAGGGAAGVGAASGAGAVGMGQLAASDPMSQYESVLNDPFLKTDVMQYGVDRTAARRQVPAEVLYQKFPHLRKKLDAPAAGQQPVQGQSGFFGGMMQTRQELLDALNQGQ